jgi:hypothetical protein
MAKKPIHAFEDELGKLVDQYLLDEQVSAEEIASILAYEARYITERKIELLIKKQRAM